MARVKWSGWVDDLLIKLVKSKAEDLERSEAFIVEMSLREMFSDQLPPGWKPGKESDDK